MLLEETKTALYRVVLNHELQYSVWPCREALPFGWAQTADSPTTREACLDHIEQVWTDMRPLTLRLSMIRHRPEGPGGPWSSEEISGLRLVDSTGHLFEAPGAGSLLEHPLRGTAGLAFSRTLEDAVADGVVAHTASCEKSHPMGTRFPLNLPHRPRLLQVRAPLWREDENGRLWAPELHPLRELPLSESCLWPLLEAYLAWQREDGRVLTSAS